MQEKHPESVEFLEGLVQSMPSLHYRIFQFLAEFLKYKVAANE